MMSHWQGVILAAGVGSRLGQVKPLAELQGSTLLDWSSRALLESKALQCVSVVVGSEGERVRAEATRLGLRTIENPRYSEGMLTSLQAALRTLMDQELESGVRSRGVLVALADQPFVRPETVQALTLAANEGKTLARPTFAGRPGNPCLIGREHWEEILEETPRDQGASFLFSRYAPQVIDVPVNDPGIHLDMDRPQDLARAERAFSSEVSSTAATLALVEVGLGSVLHTFRVPLGGHWLSLNQGFFLSRLVWKLQGRSFEAPFCVSQISALLKSLSPAGNKLGPMLSIGMQGLLFSLGAGALGATRLGIVLGMVLLSFWAFAQPLVTLYLFYGNDLAHAVQFYSKKSADAFGVSLNAIWMTLAAAVALKAVLAGFVGIAATRVSEDAVERFRSRMIAAASDLSRFEGGPTPTWQGRVRAAIKDLTRPIFLVSWILMGLFFVFAEGGHAQLVWRLLRPLAIAFLFFYFSRSPWASRLLATMREDTRFARFATLWDQTLARIRSKS